MSVTLTVIRENVLNIAEASGTRMALGRAHTSARLKFVLYPTDRPDLDPDLNQNQVGLFLSPNQLVYILSKSFHKFVFFLQN